MTTFIIQQNDSTAPVPANGKHGETLGDLERVANKLLRLIAAERAGVFDGFGQSFWVNEDAILRAARELVRLAEWRVPLIPRR